VVQEGQIILVVDDDSAIRETMAEILEAEGYKVACATNGAEALAYLQREALPCLVLLDLMMPVMSGWQFRRAQHDDERFSAVPVLILSADEGGPSNVRDLPPSDYLRKPVDLEVLLARIQTYCRPDAKPPVSM
jgi:CheY-like chemotaxis protein